ncbi:MAG TPA: hypothetical protein DCY79_14870 [Planctomycetaceae bacterium]|nr:hypothetical protein [Planctomycetaceae bacterium]
MSTVDSPFKIEDAADADEHLSGWRKFEWQLERLAERLNPILIKEARQALKSRQFVVTFSLLLGFGWGWTFLGVGLWHETVFYGALGVEMLIGYYFVLSVPLLLVVPFSAFRSLAAEREDGTFELVSITALTSRQIVTGKLGSAVLQMIVYYSALSPAIVFTYMLRGIDVLTICLILLSTFLVSLFLSAIGLLLATVTRSRNWQVFLSVVFLLSLVTMGIWWSSMIMAMLYSPLPYDEHVFWAVVLCLVSFVVSFMALVIRAAAGQITFASENRATVLRIMLVVQQLMWIGWMTYFWIDMAAPEILVIMIAFGGIYWAIAGALMSGETAELSPRARRELPQSVLGRTALTWFNPGSGTGYVFAILNMSVLVLVPIALMYSAEAWGVLLDVVQAFKSSMLGWLLPANLVEWCQQVYQQLLQFGGRGHELEVFGFGLVCLGYCAAYVGLTRLVHLLVRRYFYVGLMFSLLVLILFLVLGAAGPFVLEAMVHQDVEFDYSPLQTSNWLWTSVEMVDDSLMTSRVPSPVLPLVSEGVVIVMLVGGTGLFFFAINVILALREVEAVRQETPQRVKDDDQQLKLEDAPAQSPASPWDEPESESESESESEQD